MKPISNSLGWITRKPNAVGAPAAAPPAFNQQLQTLLQKTQSPTAVGGAPSRATVGQLHPGGLNDVAHRLLKLGGH